MPRATTPPTDRTGVLPKRVTIALPVMVCPGISAAFKDGEELEVDIDSGVVKNLTTGKSLRAEALPLDIQQILKQGGLVEVTKAKLAAQSAH